MCFRVNPKKPEDALKDEKNISTNKLKSLQLQWGGKKGMIKGKLFLVFHSLSELQKVRSFFSDSPAPPNTAFIMYLPSFAQKRGIMVGRRENWQQMMMKRGCSSEGLGALSQCR